jgi:hypothetical protein
LPRPVTPSNCRVHALDERRPPAHAASGKPLGLYPEANPAPFHDDGLTSLCRIQ